MTNAVVTSTSEGSAPVEHLKPAVDPASLSHRQLLEGPFWQKVPGFADTDETTFLDHKWQARNSATKPKQLRKIVGDVVTDEFVADVEAGFRRAPMAMRVSPYVLSLIDWSDPYNDPLRRQFIPVASTMLPDHPELRFDSLAEQADAPTPGLTHRYPDKALFLALDTCPVYCRFCTRSYAVGTDTEQVEKVALRVNRDRWARAFEYIAARPELEDIVISGGDTWQLRPEQVLEIGNTLLEMNNIRRIRFATKGLAIMPQKVLSHTEWLDALTAVHDKGRKMAKSVVIHTHFNHPRELTWISKKALDTLFERGITVRNQCVLQRGVNDSPETMKLLVKRLGFANVEPYYVFMHDLVRGVEDLRTTLQTGLDLEKAVRGRTAGFHTPMFVVDAPGGGGKRDIHSFEYYNRDNGISIYASPDIRGDQALIYVDPIDQLAPAMQRQWHDPKSVQAMIDEAVGQTGLQRPT